MYKCQRAFIPKVKESCRIKRKIEINKEIKNRTRRQRSRNHKNGKESKYA